MLLWDPNVFCADPNVLVVMQMPIQMYLSADPHLCLYRSKCVVVLINMCCCADQNALVLIEMCFVALIQMCFCVDPTVCLC